MSSPQQTFQFHTGFSGAVDKAAGIIRGVAVVTGNVTAEGHGLEVDDTTLAQLQHCAAASGQVAVNLDHGSGIKDTCGYLSNFRIEGAKVRADWFLLQSHPEYSIMMERAERMPQCFGLSIAFKGKGEKKGAKKFARCERLLSVDCVTRPAANPDGLFAAREVDNENERMPETTTSPKPEAEKPQNDLAATVKALTERVEAQEKFNQAVIESLREPSLDELAAMSEEELAELGITRAEVDAAVAEATGSAPAPAAAAKAGTAMSAGDQALAEVRRFRAEIAAREKAAQEAEAEHAFKVVEDKVAALAKQNEELVELGKKKDAEIEALRLAAKSGKHGVAPGVAADVLFQAKEAKPGSFTALTTAKYQELVKSGVSPVAARGQAVEFCVKHHEAEYQAWRADGSKTIAFTAA